MGRWPRQRNGKKSKDELSAEGCDVIGLGVIMGTCSLV